MKFALMILLALMMSTPVLAQTPTPTLTPMPTDLPPYLFGGGGGATYTPAPTYAFPTLTPITNAPFTPQRLPPPMVVGQPFVAPPLPDLNQSGGVIQDRIPAIEGENPFELMLYLVLVGQAFYAWLDVNFNIIISGSRYLILILIVLYFIFLLWRGSKYAPPDPDLQNSRRFFLGRAFREGTRYYNSQRRKRGR